MCTQCHACNTAVQDTQVWHTVTAQFPGKKKSSYFQTPKQEIRRDTQKIRNACVKLWASLSMMRIRKPFWTAVGVFEKNNSNDRYQAKALHSMD